MNFLNVSEKEAVNTCIALGDQWGYGNLIDRLQKAWALKNLRFNSFTVKDACYAAHMSEAKVNQLMRNRPSREDFIKYLEECTGLKEPPNDIPK
jgi:hypothetical protein